MQQVRLLVIPLANHGCQMKIQNGDKNSGINGWIYSVNLSCGNCLLDIIQCSLCFRSQGSR